METYVLRKTYLPGSRPNDFYKNSIKLMIYIKNIQQEHIIEALKSNQEQTTTVKKRYLA